MVFVVVFLEFVCIDGFDDCTDAVFDTALGGISETIFGGEDEEDVGWGSLDKMGGRKAHMRRVFVRNREGLFSS